MLRNAGYKPVIFSAVETKKQQQNIRASFLFGIQFRCISGSTYKFSGILFSRFGLGFASVYMRSDPK